MLTSNFLTFSTLVGCSYEFATTFTFLPRTLGRVALFTRQEGLTLSSGTVGKIGRLFCGNGFSIFLSEHPGDEFSRSILVPDDPLPVELVASKLWTKSSAKEPSSSENVRVYKFSEIILQNILM